MVKNNKNRRGLVRSVPAKSVHTVVKNMLESRMELKSVAAATGASATAAAGAVLYFTPILQDDTTNGRTGDQIVPHDITLRFTSIGSATEAARFILFQDRMNQGAAPTVSQVLSSASYNATYNHINVVLNKRFKILFDKQLDLCVAGEAQKHLTARVPLKGKIGFVDTGDTSASAGPNTLWLIYIGTSTHVVSDINYRLTYRDA
jgi:ribosomal protein L22